MLLWVKFKIWWDKDKGAEHNLFSFKSLKGKFYVVYEFDGKRSVNMDYKTARDYATMFGGKVHHVDYGEVK